MKRLSVILPLISAALLIGGVSAHASARLEPPRVEIATEPGEEPRFTVRLVNNSGAYFKLYPLVGEYDLVEDTVSVPKSPYYDSLRMISGNLEFNRDAVGLRSGESKEITGKIVVATGLPVGTYHAIVAFVPEEVKKGTVGIRLDPKTPRTVLTVSVQKKEKGNQLNLITFNPFRKLFIGFPATLTARIENGGSVALTPDIETRFTDEDDQGRGSVTTDIPENGNIGGRSVKNVPVIWEGDGGYGLYRARISVAYGSAKPQTATAEFWVFPWWLLALMALLLIVLSYGAARFIMRISRKPQPDA